MGFQFPACTASLGNVLWETRFSTNLSTRLKKMPIRFLLNLKMFQHRGKSTLPMLKTCGKREHKPIAWYTSHAPRYPPPPSVTGLCEKSEQELISLDFSKVSGVWWRASCRQWQRFPEGDRSHMSMKVRRVEELCKEEWTEHEIWLVVKHGFFKRQNNFKI